MDFDASMISLVIGGRNRRKLGFCVYFIDITPQIMQNFLCGMFEERKGRSRVSMLYHAGVN